MALTGLQIQKLLPKTNCKECGSNTCLAFAMKLAAKKTDLSQCPYASEEAKTILGAAAEPPVKMIEFGPDKKLKIGDESVLYRHEKTFVNKTLLAININDDEAPSTIDAKMQQIKEYVLERVGESIDIDLVSITNKSGEIENFIDLAYKAWKFLQKPLLLNSRHPAALARAAQTVKGSNSVLALADSETADQLRQAAQENGHSLAVSAPDLNSLAILTARLKADGFNNLILHFQTHSPAEHFQTNSISRRAALKDNFKPLGYPSLRFLPSGDLYQNTVSAVTEICKYGGVMVLPTFDPAQLAILCTLRLNIYTDPQKPIQVEPKLYAIGEPDADAPVFVTTNFSLTYFIVSGEIENSGANAWLLVPECEGMSVLTAWAAGKFSGAQIAKFAKEIGLDNLVSSRRIIIPGYVAQISGELEENMPGWKVMVGPQEAGDLESFIKARLN